MTKSSRIAETQVQITALGQIDVVYIDIIVKVSFVLIDICQCDTICNLSGIVMRN